MPRCLPIALAVALAPIAALVALLAFPAFAYHDTLGGGASIAEPSLRFHTPLIEPDGRY